MKNKRQIIRKPSARASIVIGMVFTFLAIFVPLSSATPLVVTSQHQIQNITAPLASSDDFDWFHYDNGNFYSGGGWTDGRPFGWGIRLTPEELTRFDHNNISVIRFFHNDDPSNPQDSFGEVRVYGEGTSSAPGLLLSSQEFNAQGRGWVVVNLSQTVTVDKNKELWVTVFISGGYSAYDRPAGYDNTPMIHGKGGWITNDESQWWQLADFGLDNNWMIWVGITHPHPEIAFVTDGLGVSALVKNTAPYPFEDLHWRITIQGGLFKQIHSTNENTVASLSPGQELSIKSGFAFGVGKIQLVIFVDSKQGSDYKIFTGIILGPLIILKQ